MVASAGSAQIWLKNSKRRSDLSKRVSAIACVIILLPTIAFGNGKFQIDGDVLVYDTEVVEVEADAEITTEDPDELLRLLRQNPDITRVHLNSGGGGYYAGLEMGRIIADFELHTHVVDECSSSCTYVFAGGLSRSMSRGAKVGFHHTSWSPSSMEEYYEEEREGAGWNTPFDFASWSYRDTQQEIYDELKFLMSRGISAEFALETIRVRREGLWYPTRRELFEAGYLTE